MTDFQGNIKETTLQKVKKEGDILLYGLYLDMCGPKGYGFSANLVINRVRFLHSIVLSWVCF